MGPELELELEEPPVLVDDSPPEKTPVQYGDLGVVVHMVCGSREPSEAVQHRTTIRPHPARFARFASLDKPTFQSAHAAIPGISRHPADQSASTSHSKRLVEGVVEYAGHSVQDCMLGIELQEPV